MRKQTKALKSHFQKDKENNHGNEWGKITGTVSIILKSILL